MRLLFKCVKQLGSDKPNECDCDMKMNDLLDDQEVRIGERNVLVDEEEKL
jgi:hypothetical protein